jgi:hypothetical protein
MSSEGKTLMIAGRIVWTSGDLFKGKVKLDDQTKQPVIDQKNGKPVVEYGFGLAVPKSVLQQVAPGQPGYIWTAMHEEAYAVFPSRQLPPDFAWKYKDGDGTDHMGQPFANRAGHAGHLVFAFTTRIPIKYYKFENNTNILINEGIKCGDYVNVQVMVKAHPAVGRGKAGLYLNPYAAQLIGYGEAIVNVPSGDDVFGKAAPPVPQGASVTPIAPAGMLVPTGQSMPTVMPAMAQPFAAPVPAMPMAQPHYGVLPTVHQPVGNAHPASHVVQPGGFTPPAQPVTGAFPSSQTGGFPPPPPLAR